MSQIKTLNGVQYTLPQLNDTNWGANTGNVLTQYIAAIADCTLQLTGGSFTLTADADFGGNFGLKALYIKSETANPASAGVVRLAKTDSIAWRNNANGADKSLGIDGSDNLQYAATKVLLSGAVVNADINASAAIAYSKLALAGSIVNADIASGAAVAVAKLAALTVSRAVATDGSGFLTASSVTSTELGYLSGVTSAIQTQFAATVANPLGGDLAAGSHKITGLAAATVAGNAVRYEQLIYGVAPTQQTYTTTFSTSNAAYQATGHTVAITPSTNTKRVKVRVTGLAQSSSTGQAIYTLYVNGSDLFSGTTSGIGRVTAASSECQASFEYIHSPASTSTQTYEVRLKSSGGTVQWGDATTVMIAEECI